MQTIDLLEVSDLLANLVERSMVVFDPDSGRYHLSESMRAFAADQCSLQEAEAAKQKHAAHFVDLSERVYHLVLEDRNLDA